MVANAKAVGEQFLASKAHQEFWSTVDWATTRDRRACSPTLDSDVEVSEAARSFITSFGGGERDTAELPAAPMLLFVGALSPLKGPDLLLEAFAQISQDFRDVCLLLIGPDRGMRASLVASTRSLGIDDRVHFRVSWDERAAPRAYLGRSPGWCRRAPNAARCGARRARPACRSWRPTPAIPRGCPPSAADCGDAEFRRPGCRLVTHAGRPSGSSTHGRAAKRLCAPTLPMA